MLKKPTKTPHIVDIKMKGKNSNNDEVIQCYSVLRKKMGRVKTIQIMLTKHL